MLVLGDSAAVGYGMHRADATPAAMIGLGLVHLMDAPVEVRTRAVVGAQTSDLMGQLDQVADWEPHVAVIIVGTNDVTHQVRPSTSARTLGDVVRRLVAADCEVVVGTTPDLGSVRPIKQPLRAVARQLSRSLARKQTIAVVEAGGRAVSLGGLLGNLFTEKRDIMFGVDRFHPSETGYANMVSVIIPAVAASLREKSRTYEYAGYAPSNTPRDLMSVRDAAAEAVQNPGTEVVQEKAQGGGRSGHSPAAPSRPLTCPPSPETQKRRWPIPEGTGHRRCFRWVLVLSRCRAGLRGYAGARYTARRE
ncbi:SGNH/GDSL hydrolase family protein [Aeromicrobium sp. UC242_57]|uniref:SGNH/GDSL hydrolase family protein n=1 Tax=Aeromicrobium sp. UC242_57 TaxID=3374624 RepID=UPI0037BA9CB4